MAAFCAVLLASCSAGSDTVSQLGLAPSSTQDNMTGLIAGDVNQPVAAANYLEAQQRGGAPVPEQRPDQESLAQADAPTGEDTASAKTDAPAETPTAIAEAASPTAAEELAAAEEPSDAGNDSQDAAPAANEEPAASETIATAEETHAKKRDFLSAFFSSRPTSATAATNRIAEPAASRASAPAEKPKVILAAASPQTKPVRASLGTGEALPGVRQGENLFEFSRKSGSGDADVDLYEEEPSYQVASAAGMARLAPNGLLKQRESVDTACLKPALVGVLKSIERHYRRPIIVTSGYRSPSYNQRVRGARNSLHMYCAAADVQIEGVSKWELARYVRSMPGRGGVGTYCHTESVHVDVGPERDWNWRCRRRK